MNLKKIKRKSEYFVNIKRNRSVYYMFIKQFHFLRNGIKILEKFSSIEKGYFDLSNLEDERFKTLTLTLSFKNA